MSKAKQDTVPDRLRRAFGAASSDLTPGGRLPKGMTEEKATRAVLAHCAFSLQRFAVAGEKILEVLEDTEPDEWPEDEQPVAPPRIEHPGLPGIPAGPIDPHQVAKLIEEQDRETCRKFAIEVFRWVEEDIAWPEQPDAENLRRVIGVVADIRRDLEASEVGALKQVAEWYASALGLDKVEGQEAEGQEAEGQDEERRCGVCNEINTTEGETCGRRACLLAWDPSKSAEEGGEDGA